MIEGEKEVTLRNYKKLRIRGTNIFSVEDEDTIYYVYRPKKRFLENYLAFTKENPENEDSIRCTRMIEQYDNMTEQTICTHKVRSVRKIVSNLYKVRTNHTYYMLKV